MINHKIIEDISKERNRQNERSCRLDRHDADKSDFEWSAILSEETGEVAHEALCGGSIKRAYKLRQELVQVAAVAVAWIECIDQNRE